MCCNISTMWERFIRAGRYSQVPFVRSPTCSELLQRNLTAVQPTSDPNVNQNGMYIYYILIF